ncbi:MAG: family 78 glycoside hydrolase catalytic domain [Verrucomicrobiota bacterium]
MIRVLIAVILVLAGIEPLAGSVVPVNLQCEYRSNPRGLDVAQPRLIWQVQSDKRKQAQTAYEILVASSKELLQNGYGDLWDSGRVSSDESVNIAYSGKPLASGVQCFWKVRVWDQDGRASVWSSPAAWSMGLLAAEDWRGKWIGLDEDEKPNPFEGAKWIWFPEGNPAVSAPVGTRYFRRVFELPANQAIRAATIAMTADNEFHLFVNGQEAGSGDNWKTPGRFAIGAFLKPGKNVLAVVARNVGDGPTPAGLMSRLNVIFEQENALTLDTDDGWKSARDSEDGWNTLAFDDTAWMAAKALGVYGMQPWGTIGNEDRRLPARYVRREFSVEKKVRRATAYVCGLGLFELYLNGRKMSDDALSPALSEYDARAFYLTFDATDQLNGGDNAIGVILGNGRFFAPRSSVPAETRTFGYPKLLLQLNIEYTDGTTAQIVSDENWKLTAAGPIRANNEYDGEEYDARMEMPGWCQPKFDDSNWQRAQLVKPAAPVLSAQIGEPIRVMDTLHPMAITNPKPGVYIFDMGQNMAGWCRLKVSGPRGAVVKVRHAETLKPDGTIYTDNLRSAKAEDIYTLKGQGVETYEPRFTYHGFRYVEVTGFPGKPTLSAIEGRLVHDAVPTAGQFACSNPLLNQIYHAIYWTTRDNYRSIPTDLPRDERQGWMGDRQEVSKGETYMFNVAPLYAQWLTDMQDDQHSNGSVPDVSPAYWSLYQDGVVWASTYIVIPHMLYDQYGDVGILRKHYDSMKKWTDYMASFLEDDIMPRNTYADWCFPPKSLTEMTVINSSDPKLTTSGILMSTAVFYHDLRLMARTARLLDKTGDAEHFETLAGRIKVAFNRRFYNSRAGYYDNGTQTSCVLPLAFGLAPDDRKTNVFAHLVEKITVESDNHLGTGLIGGHYLMRVLSDNGRPDLACTIATQTNYPSWGYMISKGATTMWELWNGDTADSGMNSRNIVMLIGDLNIWLHEYLGGIRPDPEAPGFKKIIIKPEIVGGLTWVKAGYDSIHGRISSEWHQSAGQFNLRVTIPANTTATVCLPAIEIKSITESGKPVEQAVGVKYLRQENDRVVLQAGSGSYYFAGKTK